MTIVKSIYKGVAEKNIQEDQRGIFLMRLQYQKIYESLLKIQNENNNENMTQMQTTETKKRSAVGSLIILNSSKENQRKNKNKTYLFFADG